MCDHIMLNHFDKPEYILEVPYYTCLCNIRGNYPFMLGHTKKIIDDTSDDNCKVVIKLLTGY